ncbi:MAG: twin-arginine translocase subunit TatC [Candidatus Gastranaerophilaceae bacterium]
MSNQIQEENFISHLEALRKMLLNSIISVAVLSPVGFFVAPKFLNFLIKISMPENMTTLHYFSPMEVFIVQIKIGILLAFLIAFPYIIYEIKKFLNPALYKNERKFLTGLIVSSSLLFVLGGIFCIFVILPLIMNFSAGFTTTQLQPTLGLNNFVSITAGLILAFGIMFQFPLAVILGVKLDLISINLLKNVRPYIFVGILIIAAMLTPPDIVSQLMLAAPTYILYEIGIFIAQQITKNTQKTMDINYKLKEDL